MRRLTGFLLSLVLVCAGMIFPAGAAQEISDHSPQTLAPVSEFPPALHLKKTTLTNKNLPGKPGASTKLRMKNALGNLPLRFEQNDGQTSEEVKFFSRGNGYTMYFTQTESVMVTTRVLQDKNPKKRFMDPMEALENQKTETSVIRMEVIGANPEAKITGQDPLPSKSHYFIGNDKFKWRRNVPNYRKVHYEEVYPGIELVYYGNQKKLEYDFVVKPGADPNRIALNFSGTENISVNDKGDLILKTKLGEVIQKAPVIYQTIKGEKKSIEGHYIIEQDQRVTFQVAQYDTQHDLVIDPVLGFSTYLGGSGDDPLSILETSIGLDSNGNIYVSGTTNSTDFDVLNEIEGPDSTTGTTQFHSDVFVFKLEETVNGLVLGYSTYLGGSGQDVSRDIAVEPNGNVYVIGETHSTDFNLLNEIEGYNGTGSNPKDIFVFKLEETTNGPTLVYSTYLGGTGQDEARGIAVDNAGNVYATGWTGSTDFNLLNQIQGYSGSSSGISNYPDVFVFKLEETSTGPALGFSTYLGGIEVDFANDIAIDNSGHIYVTGDTISPDFDLLNEIEACNSTRDIFVFKLLDTTTGPVLEYSTCLGGSNIDSATSIAIDGAGNAYVTGWTHSTDFNLLNEIEGADGSTPTNGAFTDVIVFKLEETATGPELGYSTYLGGNNVDAGKDIAIDNSSNVFVTGHTASTDFNVMSEIEGCNNDFDVFVFKLEETITGPVLIYSTCLGGSDQDFGKDLVVDNAGNVFVTGITESTDFDLLKEIEGYSGLTDVFVFKLEQLAPDTTPPTITPPADVTVEATGPLTVVSIGNATATDNVSSPANITITNDAPASFPVGTTVVTWTATDEAGNSAIATQNVTVQDTTAPTITPPADVTVEATGPLTTVSIGTATATDLVSAPANITITNDAPASFPVGTTVVTWTATDEAGSSSTAAQNVIVQDTTPPVITPPADVTEQATGPLTVVNIGTATATDLVSVPTNITITNDAPASYPVGITVVTWTATDEAGNSSTATQNVTVTDATNVLINGDFRIWQRGTAFNDAAGGQFLADRWRLWENGGGVSNVNITRESFDPGQTDVPGDPEYYLRWEVNANPTIYRIFQRIENVHYMAGQTWTLSFWARSSDSAITLSAAARYFFDNKPAYPLLELGNFTGFVNPTTTWTKYTGTITFAPIPPGQIIGPDSYVEFEFRRDGPVTGHTDIAMVQLEKGDTATGFKQRPIGLELALCQRYFQRLGNGTGEILGSGHNIDGTTAAIFLKLAPEMRTTPILSVSPSSTFNLIPAGGVPISTINFSMDPGSTSNMILLSVGVSGGLSAGQGVSLEAPSANDNIFLSAEFL